ncbi:MAG: hypothetical protein ACE3K2_02260 [Paenibacillus sp.]|uniref:hypothetical protein n=1 Tax=Paenibacillus sp. TaxID=58172 RepID=UPI003B7D319E
MDIAIVGALVSGVVGVAGVLIGGILTYKLSHRSEMVLVKKKITVDKIQETQRGLYVIARQLGQLNLALKTIENKRISQEEFRKISDQVQDECGIVIRNIRVNEVFIKDFVSLIDDLIDQTSKFNDLIYDAYIYPDNPNKRDYYPGLLEYEHIETLIMKAMLTALEIKDSLDKKIEAELK